MNIKDKMGIVYNAYSFKDLPNKSKKKAVKRYFGINPKDTKTKFGLDGKIINYFEDKKQ